MAALKEALEKYGHTAEQVGILLHDSLPSLIALEYRPTGTWNNQIALLQEVVTRISNSRLGASAVNLPRAAEPIKIKLPPGKLGSATQLTNPTDKKGKTVEFGVFEEPKADDASKIGSFWV